MSLQNFPGGVASQGIPLLSPGGPAYMTGRGKNFFVHNGTGSDSAGFGSDVDRPFATIDYAVGQCTDSRGDKIWVLEGHVETVTGAGGLDLDKIGISVIGIGQGSHRPTINFTTATTADMDVDAADIRLENLLFTGGVDALVAPIDINAADCTIVNCEWRDVTGQATDVILTDANAGRLKILNYFHNGATSAGANSGIAIVGGDGIIIDGLEMDGDFAVGGIDIRTTLTTDLKLRNAWIRTRNSVDICLIDTITGSTGMIGPNIYMFVADNAANINEAITAATMVYFGGGPLSTATGGQGSLLVVNLAGESAISLGKALSTD